MILYLYNTHLHKHLILIYSKFSVKSKVTKLEYHIALCHPTDMERAAKEMDSYLWTMLERAAGLSIPRWEGGRGGECCTSGKTGREIIPRLDV